jgi:hypothetical protein
VLRAVPGRLELKEGCLELARLIAATLDEGLRQGHVHSMAI